MPFVLIIGVLAVVLFMSGRTKKMSASGLEMLKKFEALRLKSYDDGVGVWTIGWGHTKGVMPGQTITVQQAESLLRNDLEYFERAVDSLVKTEISQSQFDALVSFAFNVGDAALARSNLLKYTNARDFQRAATEFDKWVYAKGQMLVGLAKRRANEKALFLTGVV